MNTQSRFIEGTDIGVVHFDPYYDCEGNYVPENPCIVDPLEIDDMALLQAIQQSLGISEAPSCADMLELTELHLPNTITTVEPLRYAANLKTVTLPLDTATPLDFEPVSKLDYLRHVIVTCTETQCDLGSLDLKSDLEEFTVSLTNQQLDDLDFLLDWGCDTSYKRNVNLDGSNLTSRAD